MKLSDFDYNLPKELIAHEPADPRDSSKLLVIDRKSGEISHHIFNELPNILNKNYAIVFNKTRVIPARLLVEFENGSGGEILLHKNNSENIWEVLTKPAKKFKVGKNIFIYGKNESNKIQAEIIQTYNDGTRDLKFNKNINKWIENNGITPLPPYINNNKNVKENYQTIYAEKNGSVAAPTAGLHFTEEVFANLKSKKIEKEFVTLHVGRGTFEPVKTENILNHDMHSEWYEVSKNTASKLNDHKKNNKKILAVGTTSARTLESNFKNGEFHEENKDTNLFIYPGYKFKAINALLTNFHLPKSTLLMLISALADKELIFKAYKEAIKEKYRFYSFGDSMLIL